MQPSPHNPPDNFMPPLALLAGGLATRLGPASKHVPKSLLEVAGEPFLAHQLRMLAAQGVADIVLCCGHLGAMIEEFAGDGLRFGCRVQYSYDGPAPLGTGGAIRNALPLLGDRFWVMYGDSYLSLDFRAALAAFEQSGKPALMTVFANHDRWDASNVEFSGGRILYYAKRTAGTEAGPMRHIDYGLSIFRAQTLHPWPQNMPFDLSAVQSELVARAQMAGFEVSNRFYEIGSPSGLGETDAFLRAQPIAPGSTRIGAGA